MKLYYKSRYNYFNKNEWRYTLEYLYMLQRPEYDFVTFQYIPATKYMTKSEKHLVLVNVDLTKTDKTIEDIRYDFDNFYKSTFNLAELNKEQTVKFIEDNTNLEIIWNNWYQYQIQEANEILNQKAIYLIID